VEDLIAHVTPQIKLTRKTLYDHIVVHSQTEKKFVGKLKSAAMFGYS